MNVSASHPSRARNPRGQGARLKTEIIAAAVRLIDRGSPLTLRAVAREAGVSPAADGEQVPVPAVRVTVHSVPEPEVRVTVPAPFVPAR